ncbi:MAG: hypothetical protein HY292_24660 [Planctomycetes bacterium]|nr:hypothetical protein [Planctomycetota bacterium]
MFRAGEKVRALEPIAWDEIGLTDVRIHEVGLAGNVVQLELEGLFLPVAAWMHRLHDLRLVRVVRTCRIVWDVRELRREILCGWTGQMIGSRQLPTLPIEDLRPRHRWLRERIQVLRRRHRVVVEAPGVIISVVNVFSGAPEAAFKRAVAVKVDGQRLGSRVSTEIEVGHPSHIPVACCLLGDALGFESGVDDRNARWIRWRVDGHALQQENSGLLEFTPDLHSWRWDRRRGVSEAPNLGIGV